jgi:hypothetical protein
LPSWLGSGGGGGGSGGGILIHGNSVTINGLLDASGGAGGNALPLQSFGGGGGGGEVAILFGAGGAFGTGTINVSGGAGGTGGIPGTLTDGAAGAPGFFSSTRFDPDCSCIPEPASLICWAGMGMVGLLLYGWSRLRIGFCIANDSAGRYQF